MGDILVWDDDIPTKFCPMDDPHEDHYWMKGSYYCPGIPQQEGRHMTKTDPNRKCKVCHGPITLKNQSGICTRTWECRSALQRKSSANRRPDKTSEKPDENPWLLPIVYEIDEDGNRIFVNEQGEPTPEEWGGKPIEIVDDVAIQVAVEGSRHVGLTMTEREAVVERMIRGAWSANEIARHCGTVVSRLIPVFTKLGYEVVPPRKPNGKRIAAAAEIRKIKPQEAEVDG